MTGKRKTQFSNHSLQHLMQVHVRSSPFLLKSSPGQSDVGIWQRAVTKCFLAAVSAFQWRPLGNREEAERLHTPFPQYRQKPMVLLDRRSQWLETKQGSRLRGAPREPLACRRLVRSQPHIPNRTHPRGLTGSQGDRVVEGQGSTNTPCH
jgi:hypothetical protein